MTNQCKTSVGGPSFLGVRSGNFSRSSGEECEPFLKCDSCVEHHTHPYSHTHEVTLCRCGVHKLPFFMMNNAVYNKWREAQANPTDATTPVTFDSTNLDDKTLQLSAGAFVNSSVDSSNVAHEAADAIDSVIDVVVPKNAEAGVVVDVTDLTVHADGLHGDKVLSEGSLSGAMLSDDNTVHKPRVHVFNRSNYPAYLRVEKPHVRFEGVSNQLGVRPNTHVTVQYNPVTKVWTLLDTNARA